MEQGETYVTDTIIKRDRVTPTELYAINLNPKFIGQTRLRKDNTYIMAWRIGKKEYETLNTI